MKGDVIRIEDTRSGHTRVLELRCGDMWTVEDVERAEAIIMHTEFTHQDLISFREVLRKMRVGCRFVTYTVRTKYKLWHF